MKLQNHGIACHCILQFRKGFMRISRSMLFSSLLLGCLAGCHKPKPVPSIDALSAALQRSADKALAAPPLASEQLILSAKPDQIDPLAAEVLHAASAAGGAGIRSVNLQGQVSILATIPENNADAFKAALLHESSPMAAPSSTSSRLIEVLIENATPTP